MKKRIIASTFALMLVFSLALSMTASARASDYINKTTASLTSSKAGKVTVSFAVNATRTLPIVGVDNIYVSVNYGQGWTYYGTYTAEDYPSLLGSNSIVHAGMFTFDGVSGAQFKATVNSYGEDSNGHDYSQVTTYSATCL